MKFKVNSCVFNSDKVISGIEIELKSKLLKKEDAFFDCSDKFSYPPFINGHDHLIGNWYPRSGDNRPYPNSDVWVEDMKNSKSYLERNKVWINDGKFDLSKGTANLLTSLGIYKNIFSGCHAVQDHGPNQIDEYYEQFPINVIREYRQCHSIELGNWWGGKSAKEEWEDTKGQMPFIIHLAEGTDKKAKTSFSKLVDLGLLQSNTLIIHGIALTKKEIKKCAETGTSICWCPNSNLFLIGKTLEARTCLDFGVNLILGTDSTMSGNLNLFSEIRKAHKIYPEIPLKEIFKMITTNAQKALYLPTSYGKLEECSTNLLLMNKKKEDPFENLLHVDTSDIALLVHEGVPIFGDIEYFEDFTVDTSSYYFFKIGHSGKFVIGHPEAVTKKIDSILGYHKRFPYLPF